MNRSPGTPARIRKLCVIFVALTIRLPPSSFAQMKPQKSGQEGPAIRVPFVGCESDGQLGPLAAPTESEKVVQIDPGAAQRLAYYKAESTVGVLAPRGWYCFGTYGSSGSSLFVAPQPIKRDDLFSKNWSLFTGPAIQVDSLSGGTSGRLGVARVIARVFPTQKAFAQSVIDEGFEPASDFEFGPYPKDTLIYKSDRVVEYRTPPHSEGLGTISRMQKNNDSIDGVAILQGETPDLLFLKVRLPADMKSLESYIIQQIERE